MKIELRNGYLFISDDIRLFCIFYDNYYNTYQLTCCRFDTEYCKSIFCSVSFDVIVDFFKVMFNYELKYDEVKTAFNK